MRNFIRKLLNSIILFVIVLGGLSCSQHKDHGRHSIPGYQLVWSDEFDHEGQPDAKKWTYEEGFVRNEELQWYQPKNAYCEDGLLVIEGKEERVPNPHYDAEGSSWKNTRQYSEYTSASVTTRGLHSWKYGIFQIKAKIKAEPGLWPAIWALGVENPWPHNGEIDIMEYYQDMILANFAWGDSSSYQAVWDDYKKPITEFPKNWSDDFHVWKMDWSEDSIKLYVDDMLLNEIDLKNTTNRDGSGFNPFHQPHYLILNLAIGGTQGGDPSGTKFPSQYLIDYVRVYQRE